MFVSIEFLATPLAGGIVKLFKYMSVAARNGMNKLPTIVNVRTMISATTHSSCRPCADAAIVDDTMSPAPMPAAATSRPGPINLTTLVVGAVVSCV